MVFLDFCGFASLSCFLVVSCGFSRVVWIGFGLRQLCDLMVLSWWYLELVQVGIPGVGYFGWISLAGEVFSRIC